MKTITFETLADSEWKFKVYVDGQWIMTGDADPDPLLDLLENLQRVIGFRLEMK
jgi:hypothetical protein